MSRPTWDVILGQCVPEMARMDEYSIDAVVCDPPYLISFMGKEFDSQAKAGRDMQAWHEAWAREALRVLKPGGYLLAFGGTRTSHRLACAVEDAGFEIRDTIAWMYGSGFPKSLDVSKAMDKAAGAEREVVGQRTDGRYAHGFTEQAKKALGGVVAAESESGFSGEMGQITAPATPEAEQWQGWGTAIKPSFEPVIMARKPLIGTVSANVLAYGTGALNIDATRIQGQPVPEVPRGKFESGNNNRHTIGRNGETSEAHAAGRWPANVCLSHSPECRAAGTRKVKSSQPATFHRAAAENDGNTSAAYGKESRPEGHVTPGYGDADGLETVASYECVPGCPVRQLDEQTGDLGKSASRFFASFEHQDEPQFLYQSKAGNAERSAGLGDAEGRDSGALRNSHPT